MIEMLFPPADLLTEEFTLFFVKPHDILAN